MPLNHVSQHSLTASDRQQTLPPTISPGCPVAATELLQEPGGQQAFMLPTHVHGSAAPTGHVVIVPVQLPVSAQFGGVPPAGLFLQAPPVPSIHLFKLDTSSDMAVTAPAQLPQMYLAAPSPHGLTLHTPQPPAAYALPNQDSEHYTTMGTCRTLISALQQVRLWAQCHTTYYAPVDWLSGCILYLSLPP